MSSFATLSPNRHFESIQDPFTQGCWLFPSARRIYAVPQTPKCQATRQSPRCQNYHCSPEAIPAAFTHLDEEKTVDSLIYGYVVGVPFLFLNLCRLLRSLPYRPIQALGTTWTTCVHGILHCAWEQLRRTFFPTHHPQELG